MTDEFGSFYYERVDLYLEDVQIERLTATLDEKIPAGIGPFAVFAADVTAANFI